MAQGVQRLSQVSFATAVADTGAYMLTLPQRCPLATNLPTEAPADQPKPTSPLHFRFSSRNSERWKIFTAFSPIAIDIFAVRRIQIFFLAIQDGFIFFP